MKMRHCVCVLISVMIGMLLCVAAQAENTDEHMKTSALSRQNSYLEYEKEHAVSWAGAEVRIGAEMVSDLQNSELIDSPEGMDDKSVLLNETGSVVYRFTVPETGLYQIDLLYHTIEGKSAQMELELQIDGAVPFFEASYITLSRVYRDVTAPGELRDNNDNDLTPKQEEVYLWQTCAVQDFSGVYAEPYAFYLTEGEHQITVIMARESMILHSMHLHPAQQLESYEDVLTEWASRGLQEYSGELLTIQAEQSSQRSDSILYARSDRSSPDTVPYSPSKIRLNTIGGDSWNSSGQWIEWIVEAPADGLYTFGFRARQNILSGSFSTRELMVNGEVQYQEALEIELKYDMGWQRYVLPYKVALKEGENVIRMTATPGRLTDIIAEVDQALYELNTAYRNVIMITSSEPDPYRDYMLEDIIPDAYRIFREAAKTLRTADDTLAELTGERGSMNGTLQSFADLLEDFEEEPDTVQDRVGTLKDNIIALGTWLLDIKESPLELDCLYFAAGDGDIPAANGNFLAQAWHEVQAFAYSFVEDYNLIGGAEEAERTITVWVQAGRDQANIIKDLIVNRFTPETGIAVNLKLVQGQLLAATVSGNGPDVALQVGIGEPVNYALRDAAMPLNDFDGFETVAAQFRQSAMEPMELEDVCYGLPETQTFPVMFYRTDIFDELGLEAPETWEETYRVIGKLQKKNMNMGVPNALSSMAMLLYQNGGEFYTDDNRRSGLDSEAAITAFENWLTLYCDYALPISYDAATRFRSGEMPLLIADYTMYSYFAVMAPEIRGLWDIAAVPGTVQDTGAVNHAVSSTGTASMILKNTQSPEDAWAFMEWWTRAETQLEYGRSLEAHLGESARYPTANVEAFSQLSWPVKALEVLNAQWQHVQCIPEVAGGYFTSRHMTNAFLHVYNSGDDAKDTLLDYVRIINEEIAYKRKEVGLDP